MVVDGVDLVEVVRIGVGGAQASKWRLWSGGQLVTTEDGESEFGSAGFGTTDGVCVVESYFDNRETESEYWDPRSGRVLREATVDWGLGPVWWSVDRRFFDAYASVDGVPDATFFARLRLLGLALDPTVGFEVDVRLEDGFPVGSDEPTRAPVDPEIVITGSVDEVMSWCTGQERLIDLPSVSLDTGSPFIMGVLAGTLLMSGGFTIPPDLAQAAAVLVRLVGNHRRAWTTHGALL